MPTQMTDRRSSFAARLGGAARLLLAARALAAVRGWSEFAMCRKLSRSTEDVAAVLSQQPTPIARSSAFSFDVGTCRTSRVLKYKNTDAPHRSLGHRPSRIASAPRREPELENYGLTHVSDVNKCRYLQVCQVNATSDKLRRVAARYRSERGKATQPLALSCPARAVNVASHSVSVHSWSTWS